MTIRDIAIAFGYEVDKQSEKKVNDSINKLKSTATKVLGAIGIGFSLVNANKVIEEFGKINAQIKNATNGLGDQKEIQNEIINAANAARVAYADIADMTAKLVQQNRDLFDVTSAAKYAELTTKLFKSENKSQGEILALQEAINKSFATGAVDAETVNQILEKSPTAVDLLAKTVGVAKTELADMASNGRISLQQLRDVFLGNAESIEAAFANVDLTITDALLSIRNGWGLWLTQMDSTLGVTRTIAKFMTRMFNQIMAALRKVQTWTERVVNVFGGAENMLRSIAIAGGAIFAALNAGKILSFLTSMIKLINMASLKFLAIAAVIAIVALLIEDFVNFMQGNDSLLGELLKMAGIDADAVRKAIIDAWNAIRVALEAAWNGIKTLAFVIFDALKAFWSDWGDTIISIFGDIWALIGKLFDAALDALKGAFDLFAAVIVGDWQGAWNAVKDIASAVWGAIVDTVEIAISIIVKTFEKLCDVSETIASIRDFFIDLWANLKNGLTDISNFFKSTWSGISDFFTSIWEGIKTAFSTAADFFGGVFTTAASNIKNAFGGLKDFFSNLFQAIANVVKAPVNGIISGINGVLSGMNKIKIPDWVPNIGGKGISFPSIPLLAKGGVLERGQTGYLEGDGAEAVVPLEKNTEWIAKVAAQFKKNISSDGADTIESVVGAVKDIGGIIGSAIKSMSEKAATAKANADNSGIIDALKTFDANIAILAKSATASPGTVQTMATSTTNRSITQNNYFESTFNGDRAGQKRSAEAMSKNTNDATGELARALAFAR